METGAPAEVLEENIALAALENRLFGRGRRWVALSRYVIFQRIGTGGAGLVYQAYDPELDRKVAIKILHTRGTRGRKGAARLMREAQAMARLSHPNVIAVHDVGHYTEADLGFESGSAPAELEIPPRGVFLVMELVPGTDIASWLEGRRRSWREIVAVFVQAGRGIAAAHLAGLVHRDFKPGNVLVGDDGRVRVLDFGLARTLDSIDVTPRPGAAERGSKQPAKGEPAPAGEQPAPLSTGPAVLEGMLRSPVTQDGAVLGTPAFMAPEQHEAADVDERTDQFSYCAALYSALVRASPFSGDSLEELAEAKRQGRLRPPPADARVPRALLRVLRRGLQPDPSQRYPSMSHLLDDLQRVGWTRRRWAAGVAVAVVGGAALVFSLVGGAEDPCGGGRDQLAGIWDRPTRVAVQRAFAAADAPFSKAAWDTARKELDAYATRWERGYREACEATHLRHEQSEQMLDLRMACLQRRLREIEGVTEAFREADRRVLANAVRAVKALTPLDRCDDVEALASRVPPPADPEDRRRVDEQFERLNMARALSYAGRWERAAEIAEGISTEARQLSYAPLLAAARYQLGIALMGRGEHKRAEQALLEAIWAAEESRHEELAADAWIELVWLVGVDLKDPERGHFLAGFAAAALRRLGEDAARTARFEHNLGGVYYAEQRYKHALEHYGRALKIQSLVLGDDDPAVAQTHSHMCNAFMFSGRRARARPHCEESLAMRRRLLGDMHPYVAASLNNLTQLTRMESGPEAALPHAERAMATVEQAVGPEAVIAAELLAQTQHELENHRGELRARQRKAEVLAELYGEEDPRVRKAREAVELGRLRTLVMESSRRTAMVARLSASSLPTLPAWPRTLSSSRFGIVVMSCLISSMSSRLALAFQPCTSTPRLQPLSV
jgi:serine/threonine protein kinase/tetratricopeptide (TPR) repeat protein